MIRRLAWVSAREARGHDLDEPPALAALAASGVTIEVVDWDDADVDWSSFDRAVIRSTWDYPQHLSAFGEWLDRVAEVTELVNPPAMVRWNLDKRYLAELAADGVPVTHTDFVAPGEQARLPDGRFVIKPTVGAGSRGVASFGPDDLDAAAAHLARLHQADQVAMVQPLIASVATEGEWPLLYFGGEFSHAANKRVTLPESGTLDALFAEETLSRWEATPEQLTVAQAAIEAVVTRHGTPAYARIDLVRDDDGQFRVLEVELVEPSLFLAEGGPGAPERLAAALTR